jgi:hypothetical protein
LHRAQWKGLDPKTTRLQQHHPPADPKSTGGGVHPRQPPPRRHPRARRREGHRVLAHLVAGAGLRRMLRLLRQVGCAACSACREEGPPSRTPPPDRGPSKICLPRLRVGRNLRQAAAARRAQPPPARGARSRGRGGRQGSLGPELAHQRRMHEEEREHAFVHRPALARKNGCQCLGALLETVFV